jgi:hypothetical protein
MTINSRAKGARGERLFCQALMELYGINSRRSQQYCGKTGDAADVVSDINAHLEIKCVERLNLAEAYDQARADSKKSGRTPVVAHKKNRGPWLITMALSDIGKFIADNQHLFIKDGHENTSRGHDASSVNSSCISDDELSSNPMLKE